MGAKQVVGLIGGVLLAAGVLLGLLPVSSDGAACGRAFQSSTASTRADVAVTQGGVSASGCQDARSGRLTAALVVLVPGALVVFAAVAAGRGEATEVAPTAPRGTSAPGAR